jgi:hypothetical protein
MDDFTASWRQGYILPEAMVRALKEGEPSLPGDWDVEDTIVVFTHSCDAVSPDYEAEPSVEVLRARECTEAERDGNLTWGKNPRLFQFEADLGRGVRWYQVFVHDKAEFDRKLLSSWKPDPARSVPASLMYDLAIWRGKRYSRRASPDEFNRRMRAEEPRFRRALKRRGARIAALFLITQDAELPEEEPYVVALVATMRVDDYASSQQRETAFAALSQAAAFLDACDGIECEDWSLVSEADVSLADVRGMQRWDLDDLSLRTAPPQAMHPDELR